MRTPCCAPGVWLTGLLLALGLGLAASTGSLRAEAKPDETLHLFNGKDLSNFYTYLEKDKYEDPDRVFTVVQQDGAPAIRVSGQGYGGFITKEEYDNYHLVAEFKWGKKTWSPRDGKAMDSGILFHCTGPDGNAGHGWMASIECQVIEGGCGDFIMVGGKDTDGKTLRPVLTVECEERDGQLYYKPGGNSVTRDGGRFNWYARDPNWKDVQGFRGEQDVESPAGQWTRMEVISDGGKITNKVNGKVVNLASKSTFTRGKILFQCEGAEVFYRKVDLTPLKGS